MELTRQQLYDKVWEKGTGALQQELDLSYAELKKMCEDLDIPRPSSGYWSALNFGKEAVKMALPTLTEDMPEKVETDDYKKVRRTTEQSAETKQAKEEIGLHAAKIDAGDEIYKVPAILSPDDPIIIDTVAKQKEMIFQKENGWSAKNPFKCKAENYLDINVSKDLFDRALRVFFTIINAARYLGYEIDTKHKKDRYGRCEGGTSIIVKGQRIRVDMTESNRQVKNTENDYPSFLLIPSGGLKFRILAEYSSWNKEIKDTPSKRLEDKVEVIIRALEAEADRRIEAERQRKIREEQRRIDEERKRCEEEERIHQEILRKNEREKVISLLFDVERHAIAERMYDYIRAFQKVLADNGIELTDEIRDDIDWMQKKADWMNPFLKDEDDILSSEDFKKILHPNEKDANNSYRGWDEFQESKYNYWQMKNAWWRRK